MVISCIHCERMFMKILRVVLLLSVFGALTAGCSDGEERKNTELPWSDVTFVDPIPTTLSFINQSADTLDLRVTYEWELPLLGRELPDTLWPGDSFLFNISLYRPEDFVIDARYRRIFYALYPGMDRRIVYGPFKNTGVGINADIYAPADSVETWDPTSVGQSTIGLPLNEFIEHVSGLRDTSVARLQRYAARTNQPAWVVNLLQRRLTHKMLHRFATYPGYYRYFYQQKIQLPPAIAVELDAQARSDGFLDGSMHQDILLSTAIYQHRLITEADSIIEESRAERYTTVVDFIEQLPDTLSHKASILAALIDDEIRNGHDYAGKEELIYNAMKVLPASYAKRLNQIDQRLSELRTEQNSLNDTSQLLTLLSTPFERRNLANGDLLNVRQKPLTLYKFWFAGCYPCLRLQPVEAELRKQYTDLEIISVAFSTKIDKWKPYLKRHQPPADAFFYIPEQQKGLVRRGMGSLGAPQYLLLGPDDEVICRACPKPDDPSLRSLIQARLN